MTIREENMDLLAVPQGYYLAHCITADFSLGAGVAKQIDEAFGMREQLQRHYDYSGINSNYDGSEHVGEALLVANVYNLVLKKNPTKKAKYKKLRMCLEDLKICIEYDFVTKLAMPKIGCGHEELEWERVRGIIEEVFADTDVEILVCSR